MTGHLPQEPYLPRATAEEYCNRFLEVLKACLLAYPPALPTPQAVGLLVAVAEMQRCVWSVMWCWRLLVVARACLLCARYC